MSRPNIMWEVPRAIASRSVKLLQIEISLRSPADRSPSPVYDVFVISTRVRRLCWPVARRPGSVVALIREGD